MKMTRLGSRIVLDATETKYRSMEKGTNVLALVSAGSTPSAPIHGRSDKLTIKDSQTGILEPSEQPS
jgi:hypothetical protein